MAKPRVIIADLDSNYIVPLQFKFITEFWDKIDLEIITDEAYFDELFSKPQNAQVLIVCEELYSPSLSRHNITNVFVMMEQLEEGGTGDLNVNQLFKYTSIKEIFNEILGISAESLSYGLVEKKETQIILVTSAAGGVGKTTVAMGVAASLAQNYKRVLYINAARLQTFQCSLENSAPVSESDVYAKLMTPSSTVYEDIKHVIRREGFSYLPPLKAAIMSLGIDYSIFEQIALSAKRSNDFDFVIVDAESSFDEHLINLVDVADRVILVTGQSFEEVGSTNLFVSNLNGVSVEKYLFVCNKFNKDKANALISPEISLKFNVNDYVEEIGFGQRMRMDSLISNEAVKKVAYWII